MKKCSHCDNKIDDHKITLTIESSPNAHRHPEIMKDTPIENKYFCDKACQYLSMLDDFDILIPEHHPSLLTWVPVIRQFHDALMADLNEKV